MISIKKNIKPNLPICKMNCDEDLSPKLNNYDMTTFLNRHQCSLILGKPGSGKTSILYSLFKSKKLLKGTYDKVFLFRPTLSGASMKDDIFEKLPQGQRYHELNYENLLNMVENLDEGNNCLIFDDMTAYLKNNDIRKLLQEIIYNRRHMHISIYFLCQTWHSIHKDIRRLFNNLIVFKTSKNELETIFQELIAGYKDKTDEIYLFTFDKPHNYLFINVDSQRFYKDFDEIIFEK
jgi:hypothetical protein